MQYSGIVVILSPARFESSLSALQGLPGVEVHQTDPVRHRAVLVVETDTLSGQMETFRTIQSLPDVLGADLVYHLPGPESTDEEPTTDAGTAFVRPGEKS